MDESKRFESNKSRVFARVRGQTYTVSIINTIKGIINSPTTSFGGEHDRLGKGNRNSSHTNQRHNNMTKKKRLVGGLQESYCKRTTVSGDTEDGSGSMEQPPSRSQCW